MQISKSALFQLVGVLLLGWFAFFMVQRDARHSEMALMDLKNQVRQQRQQDALLVNLETVARSSNFLSGLSPEEALLWNVLVRRAELSTNSSATKEYRFGALLLADFHDDLGLSCSAVVGVVEDRPDIYGVTAVVVRPCLVFYAGAHPGQTIRFETLDDPQTAEIYDGLGSYRSIKGPAVKDWSAGIRRCVYSNVLGQKNRA